MSLEAQISPVEKRIPRDRHAAVKMTNLNESNQTTSQLMTPNEDLSSRKEDE